MDSKKMKTMKSKKITMNSKKTLSVHNPNKYQDRIPVKELLAILEGHKLVEVIIIMLMFRISKSE